MKNRLIPSLLLLLSLLGSAGGTSAQAAWRDLPPEQRREMRQQMREHWQQERDIRRDTGERRGHNVSPEDRRSLRDEMRQQGREPGKRDGQDGLGRGGGRRD
ncbi:MAG: hypothetical protein CVU16_06540 [Betaproteobacteria bacterium HGW-Betaproteobacteria-10]|nr:MAG: hypothetical protein CVU16_06540 [Betaproteobacteria bacterium HGW-Betaproteobacteria-10]